MYTLYGYRGSGSAMVEAALLSAGQPFHQIDAAEWDAASALAELRALNPLAQIPTLVLPDSQVLSESAAILIHLGLAHPDSGLLPKDAMARAQAIRGLVYIAANCYAAISVIDYPQRYCDDPDEALRQRIIATTRKRLHGLWDDFADSFGAGLKTEPPDALALMACVVSKWSGTRPHLAASRPAFHAALLRVEQHAAVAAVFARHWPAK